MIGAVIPFLTSATVRELEGRTPSKSWAIVVGTPALTQPVNVSVSIVEPE